METSGTSPVFPVPSPGCLGDKKSCGLRLLMCLPLEGSQLEETPFIFLEWQYTPLNVFPIIFIDLSGFLYGQKEGIQFD